MGLSKFIPTDPGVPPLPLPKNPPRDTLCPAIFAVGRLMENADGPGSPRRDVPIPMGLIENEPGENVGVLLPGKLFANELDKFSTSANEIELAIRYLPTL